jgi:TPR repeat protein
MESEGKCLIKMLDAVHSEEYSVAEEIAQNASSRVQGELGKAFAELKMYNRAMKWLTLAAQNNDARACYNLAIMYGYGNGVAQSQHEQIRWLKKAAELGYKRADDLLEAARLLELYSN